MPKSTAASAKPHNNVLRPELTRLPELTPERQAFRAKLARFCASLIRLLTRASFYGLENFPKSGPGLIVANHLGDADIVITLAGLEIQPDGLAKIELFDLPILGRWLDRYGAIWIHRGTADRRALRAALDGLAEGRFVAIAPEARQSLTGALEEGTGGAAYLALKTGVPIIPIALTGTQDENVYGSWLRLRKPEISLTIGPPFSLEAGPPRAEAIHRGTEMIMRRLAALLPEAYRGIYSD